MHTRDNLVVRLAHGDDAMMLAPLVRALALEEGYAQPPSVDTLGPWIAALINDGVSDFFLALQHDEPVGCLQLNYRRSTWALARYGYIEDFYIVPDARSVGIGTTMLEVACTRAKGAECAYVELDVRAENSGAQRLYVRHGFRRSHSELWRRTL